MARRTEKTFLEALSRLCASGDEFDEVVRVFQRNHKRALSLLPVLLRHPDPAWQKGAAAAMGRLRSVPARALADLLVMLRNPDASVQVAALSAIEWLPANVRTKAVPSIIRLLESSPPAGPRFTHPRANVPRGVAAHFLGTHGGSKGVAALERVARRRGDPILYQIHAAIERGHDGHSRNRKAAPLNSRLHSTPRAR